MILLADLPKLVDELLQPIEGDNPSGRTFATIRSTMPSRKRAVKTTISIKAPGRPNGRFADLAKVISLSTETLKKTTKDLQITVWFTHALLRKEAFTGLAMGFKLCQGLLDKFWDTLYPIIEDGDLEGRVAPLGLFASRDSPLTLDKSVRHAP